MCTFQNKSVALTVAGLVFSAIFLLHVLRVMYHIHIMVADYSISMSVSWVGGCVAFFLAVWMFVASKKQ